MKSTILLITIVCASAHPDLGIAAPCVKAGDGTLSVNGEKIDSEAASDVLPSRTPCVQKVPLVVGRDDVPSTRPVRRRVSAQWVDTPSRHRAQIDRPTTGLGLLIPGAVMAALGMVLGSTLSVLNEIDHEIAAGMWPVAVVAGGLLAAGVPMTVVGGVRLHRFRRWRAEQRAQQFVRGGGTLGFELALSF